MTLRWYSSDTVNLYNNVYKGYVGVRKLQQSENMQSQDERYNGNAGIDLAACDLMTHYREENNAKHIETGTVTFGGHYLYEKTNYSDIGIKMSGGKYSEKNYFSRKLKRNSSVLLAALTAGVLTACS